MLRPPLYSPHPRHMPDIPAILKAWERELNEDQPPVFRPSSIASDQTLTESEPIILPRLTVPILASQVPTKRAHSPVNDNRKRPKDPGTHILALAKEQIYSRVLQQIFPPRDASVADTLQQGVASFLREFTDHRDHSKLQLCM